MNEQGIFWGAKSTRRRKTMKDRILGRYIAKNHSDNVFTDRELQVIKQGDTDTLVETFLHMDNDYYKTQMQCTLKSLGMFMDCNIELNQIDYEREYKGQFIGCQVISEELGLELKDTTMDMLGRAKSVKVQKENTVIVDGEGAKEDIDARVAQIKAQLEETTSEFDKEKLQERLAKLAGGVAVIRVGAATETEMKEAKLRMEDALNATRAAVEEGVVSGGGSAYIHASKKVAELVKTLSGDEKIGAQIILKALEAPLFHIAYNAGLEGAVIINKVRESEVGTGFDAYKEEYVNMIDAGILDPAKVTRSALQNATSVASTLLTTESVVANIKEDAPAMPAGGAGMGGMM